MPGAGTFPEWNNACHERERNRIYCDSKTVSCKLLRTFFSGSEYIVLTLYTTSGRVWGMKFYTIKLPRFIGGFVKAILNTFHKKT